MPKTIAEIYDTLTETSQQEVFDFMLYLVQKEKNIPSQLNLKEKMNVSPHFLTLQEA